MYQPTSNTGKSGCRSACTLLEGKDSELCNPCKVLVNAIPPGPAHGHYSPTIETVERGQSVTVETHGDHPLAKVRDRLLCQLARDCQHHSRHGPPNNLIQCPRKISSDKIIPHILDNLPTLLGAMYRENA